MHNQNFSKNLYDILGVDKNATMEEIKKAYREKAIKTHPDKGGDGKDFAELSYAYEILSNPQKRREYDTTGVTSDTPDEEKAAVAHIKSLVAKIVKDNCNDDSIRLFSSMSSSGAAVAKKVQQIVRKQVADTKQSILNVNTVIRKLEDQKKRFRLKKNAKHKFDIFTSTVDELIENSKNFKAQAECQLKMLDIAFDYANDYEDIIGNSFENGNIPMIDESSHGMYNNSEVKKTK